MSEPLDDWQRLIGGLRAGDPVVVREFCEGYGAALHRLAALWKSKLDWDFQVTSDGFHDPAGRTGLVFGLTPAKVLAFGKSPYTQTRYLFGALDVANPLVLVAPFALAQDILLDLAG